MFLAKIAWSKHQHTLLIYFELISMTLYYIFLSVANPNLFTLLALFASVYLVNMSTWLILFAYPIITSCFAHSGALSILRRTLQVIALVQLWVLPCSSSFGRPLSSRRTKNGIWPARSSLGVMTSLHEHLAEAEIFSDAWGQQCHWCKCSKCKRQLGLDDWML